MTKQYYVYIIANKSDSVLYTGITSNIEKRMYEHKNKMLDGFTKKYNVNKLVYFEEFNTSIEAISVEKKIKGWSRKKKIELIKKKNSEFKDLSS